MTKLFIRQLTPKDWNTYQSIRLESLKDSPDSFGSTFEIEAQYSDIEWQDKLDLTKRNILALPLIAELNSKPVGIAWGFIHSNSPTITRVYQMWVSPDYRGQRIGEALLEEIVHWSKTKSISGIELSVTTSNEAAINLYKRLGFSSSGKIVPLRAGSSLTQQFMYLHIK